MEGLLLPGAPPSRAYLVLGSEYHFIIVGTYTISPITAEPCRAKATSLRVRRSYFTPNSWAGKPAQMVEVPGTAPGSEPFITRAFIAIAGEPAASI